MQVEMFDVAVRAAMVGVKGYRSTTPGLAVTQALVQHVNDLPRTVDGWWTVTHIAAGKDVLGFAAASVQLAMDACEALGELGDWTRSEQEMCADDKLRRAVHGLLGGIALTPGWRSAVLVGLPEGGANARG